MTGIDINDMDWDAVKGLGEAAGRMVAGKPRLRDRLPAGKPERFVDESRPKVKRDAVERAKDSFLENALKSPFGIEGLVIRPYLKHVKGMSDDTINELEKRVIKELERRSAEDPAFQGSFKEQGAANAGRMIVDFLGAIVGGVDPTYVLAPGKTAVQRVAAQSGINAGMDAASQGVNVSRGTQDRYNPVQTGVNAAAGVAIQGGQEALAKYVTKTIIPELEGGGTLHNPKVSPKGAIGVMQVMPATARKPGFGIRPWDGKSQADLQRVGEEYYGKLLEKYDGDHAKALAAYNGGPGRVDATIKKDPENWLRYMPAETRNYVRNGLKKIDEVSEGVPPMNPRDIARATGDEEAGVRIEDAFDEPEMRVDDVEVRDPIDEEEELADFLTPAERQEMDASVPTVPRDNTGYEKHTPYVERPPEAANENPPNPELHPSPREILFTMEGDENDLGGLLKYGRRYTEDGSVSGQLNPDTSRYGAAVSKDGEYFQWQERRNPETGKWEVFRPAGAWDQGMDWEGRAARPKPNSWDKIKEAINSILKDDSGSYRDTRSADDIEPPSNEDIEKLIASLADARKLRYEQQGLINKARAERGAEAAKIPHYMGGEAAANAMLGTMKGEMPKVKYESIAHNFTQEERDRLFDVIIKDNYLGEYDKINGINGLKKLLSEEAIAPPTKSEINTLSKVFPKRLLETLEGKKDWKEKGLETLREVLAAPRALMATGDLSAPLRQGIFLIGRKEWRQAFGPMLKRFLDSPEAFAESQGEIARRATYKLMHKNGLALTGVGRFADEREEQFMSHMLSNFIEKLPVPNLMRRSEQAYVGFLNKLRADVFDDFVRKAQDLGIDIDADPKYLKDAARFINAATGRGSLGNMSQAATVLSQAFFSPRLIASRLQLLNPVFYARLHPAVRKEALKDLGRLGAFASSVLGLAAMAGATVITDPKSTDFAKIKVGDTRFDILGGFQQYIVAGARIATNMKTTNAGEEVELGSKYGQDTRKDILFNLFENKTAPIPSFVIAWADGKEKSGEDFELWKSAGQRVWPILWQDTKEMVDEYGPLGGLLVLPAVFGVGMGHYETKPPKEKKSDDLDWGAHSGGGVSVEDLEW